MTSIYDAIILAEGLACAAGSPKQRRQWRDTIAHCKSVGAQLLAAATAACGGDFGCDNDTADDDVLALRAAVVVRLREAGEDVSAGRSVDIHALATWVMHTACSVMDTGTGGISAAICATEERYCRRAA